MTPSAPPIPRPATSGEEERAFYESAEAYLRSSLQLNPVSATYYGYHAFDGRLEDHSPGGIQERVRFYREARALFAGLARGRMSTGALIDLDLVTGDIEASLFSLEELKPHIHDPGHYNELLGYGTLFLTILEEGDPAWPDRLESLLSRMDAIPRFLDQAKANLADPPRVVTEFILQQHRANIAFFEETLPGLYRHAPALAERLDAARGPTLRALESYESFLRDDLLPRSNGDWRLGPERWARKLRLSLQSDLGPEEIQSRAWERLRSERAAMLGLAEPLHASMFPEHAHGETGEARVNVIVREVIDRISLRHSTPDRLFPDVKERWVPRARDFIRKVDLLTLPPESDNFVVERTPGFLDGLAVAFFQPPPAFEPHLKKSYWISSIPATGNPEGDRARAESFLREYNDYGLQSLTIHEALPGHYVQFWYAMNSPYASIYKKIYANNTFAEGWAVLVEEQMFAAGYAADEPECLLIHKKINLRSPINAILDARLHTERMTDVEADRWALDFMREYGFQEEAEAVGKLRRAKITAAQLSTYFVGLVELGDLLRDCRAREGAAFSLRRFNETLLSFGTIPPRAVRRLMLEGMDTA
ncbi:MAG: DUF885 domain-containing protein [Acidobacteria bacterium]|nr:DUF885 domain-containing protein [Acidobacteriota bacterium]